MSTAMLEPAYEEGIQLSSTAAEIDEEGQQYLDVQRHAAAVQLHSRSLAIAHLRAHLAMPRGASVKTQPDSRPVIKQEDGTYQLLQKQQRRQADLRKHSRPVIRITVPADSTQQPETSSPAANSQQQPGKQPALKPRQLVRRVPDAAVLLQFRSELPDDEPEVAAELALQHAGAATPAPRIVADVSQLGHQLAGWSRVAGDDEEAGGAAEMEGMDGEELVGQEPVPAAEDDMMDEEEWV